MNGEEIRDLIEYYREQGAPQDQQMIIALLREAQDTAGGVLEQETLEEIARAYEIKEAVLRAIIRRVPGLRCRDVPHRLEVCGTCRAGARLRSEIEKAYGVTSGGCSETAGFFYQVTPCMKNCKNGPSVRWDGRLYGKASMDLIRGLLKM